MPDQRDLRALRDSLWRRGPVYTESDRALARLVARPVREFLRV
jgi:NhaA family Na+:H+ antiporter